MPLGTVSTPCNRLSSLQWTHQHSAPTPSSVILIRRTQSVAHVWRRAATIPWPSWPHIGTNHPTSALTAKRRGISWNTAFNPVEAWLVKPSKRPATLNGLRLEGTGSGAANTLRLALPLQPILRLHLLSPPTALSPSPSMGGLLSSHLNSPMPPVICNLLSPWW